MPNNYIIKNIMNTKETSALFFNQIQRAYRKYATEFVQPNEKIFYKVDENDKSIIYKYNSLGFRSDEFTKEHNGLHVLFSGCSETEGSGGNLEDLWSWMLYQKLLESHSLSGFYNISRAGWGWQSIVSNLIQYIGEYGSPDYLFIMFPNIGRNIKWVKTDSKDQEIYHQEMVIPYSSKSEEDPLSRKPITIEFQRNILVNNILIIKLFEEYCRSKNIKLYWSIWDQLDQKNYESLNVFNNFIKVDETLESFINNNFEEFEFSIKKKENWLRKRDGHHGYLPHFIWYKNFLKVSGLDSDV